MEGIALGLVVVPGGSLTGAIGRAVAIGAATALCVAASRSARRVRGVVAVTAGLVGTIVGAAIGVSHLVRAGASRTSVAGVVCLSASVVVLAWGAVFLVRAARGWHKLLALPVAVIVLQFVAVPLFGAIAITNAPPDEVDASARPGPGIAYDEVTFETADGVRLAGWYVASANRAAVVALAGSGSTRTGVLEHAEVLARHGYGTLIMDHRGHGRSEGVAMDTGWFGDLDIAAAVDFLRTRPDVDPERIGVLGLSMGGEEAIGAAGADARVRAVVAEGATARDSTDHRSSQAGLLGWTERVVTWEQFRLADLLTDARASTPAASGHGGDGPSTDPAHRGRG